MYIYVHVYRCIHIYVYTCICVCSESLYRKTKYLAMCFFSQTLDEFIVEEREREAGHSTLSSLDNYFSFRVRRYSPFIVCHKLLFITEDARES